MIFLPKRLGFFAIYDQGQLVQETVDIRTLGTGPAVGPGQTAAMKKVGVVQLVLDYPTDDHTIEVAIDRVADLADKGAPFDHGRHNLYTDFGQLRLHDLRDILP